jgi:hypothetical protein
MAEVHTTARSLVELPPNHDIVIDACAEHLNEALTLREYTKTILDVARYIYIATLSLAKDAWLLTKAREALFQVFNICSMSSLLVLQLQDGVLENLKVGYGNLSDGDREGVMVAKAAVETGVHDMNGAVVNTKNALRNLQRRLENLLESNLEPEIRKTQQDIKVVVEICREDEERTGGILEGQVLGHVVCPNEEAKTTVFGSAWDVEINLPRTYSSILILSAFVTFFLVALILINQYLHFWGMVADTYPPLIFVALVLLIVQLLIILVAIRAMVSADSKLEEGNYRYLLPYAPLAICLVFAGIVLVIYELCDLANLPDKAFVVWFAMPLLVLQMLLFVVVGFWHYWGYRHRGGLEPVPSLDWEPMGEIDRAFGVVGMKSRSSELTAGLGSVSSTGLKIRQKLLGQRHFCLEISIAVLNEALAKTCDASASLERLMPTVEGWVRECTDVLEDVASEQSPKATTEENKKVVEKYYCR